MQVGACRRTGGSIGAGRGGAGGVDCQAVEGTDWRKGTKDEWAAKERAVLRGTQFKSVDKDQVYDKG